MFEKLEAIKFAKLSELAYTKSSYSFRNNSVLLEEDSDSQYIAFRGTDDFSDIVEDISIFKVNRGKFGGKVQDGFADAYEQVRPFILRNVSRSKKVYITGHSLGAAMAILCAVELKGLGYNVQKMYTFGQPRVGNADWKKFFGITGIELYRIVNGTDIVTRIPKLFAYHVGTPVYLDDGKIVKEQPSAWVFIFWKRVSDFTSHEITSYIKELQRL